MLNIFAYTIPTINRPAYVSLNQRDGDSGPVELAVRSSGHEYASVINLSDEELGKLAASIQIYLQNKQV